MFYLNDTPNVVHFAQLMSQFERMVVSGKAPYPIERTLLTSGLVEVGIKSLAADQKRLLTPQLAIRYQAPRESFFLRS